MSLEDIATNYNIFLSPSVTLSELLNLFSLYFRSKHNIQKIPVTGFLCRLCSSRIEKMVDIRKHRALTHRLAQHLKGMFMIFKKDF